MMEAQIISVQDMFYLIFGVAGLVSILWTIISGTRKTTGDDRERIVRIDANSAETRADVADIKVEIRSINSKLNDHDTRLATVETKQAEQGDRISDLEDIVDGIKTEHIAYCHTIEGK